MIHVAVATVFIVMSILFHGCKFQVPGTDIWCFISVYSVNGLDRSIFLVHIAADLLYLCTYERYKTASQSKHVAVLLPLRLLQSWTQPNTIYLNRRLIGRNQPTRQPSTKNGDQNKRQSRLHTYTKQFISHLRLARTEAIFWYQSEESKSR